MKKQAAKQLSADELEQWMVKFVATKLKISPQEIATDQEFSNMAFDSAMAMELTADLEDLLGRRISPTLVYNFSTIEQLAQHLVGTEAAE